jgi:hypothetical protein
MPQVTRLATLPSRQTPLLIGEATHHHVQLRITLPKGAKLVGSLKKQELKDGERQVSIADELSGSTLLLERTVQVPAGRVQPSAYPDFASFARRADDLLSSNIRVSVVR